MKLSQFTNRENIGRNLLLLVAGCISLPLLWVTLKALDKRKRAVQDRGLTPISTEQAGKP